MDTLRSIMQKVDALTNEVALLRVENKALSSAVKLINDKLICMPTQQVTPSDNLTSDGVESIIRNLVNQDYINKQYGK